MTPRINDQSSSKLKESNLRWTRSKVPVEPNPRLCSRIYGSVRYLSNCIFCTRTMKGSQQHHHHVTCPSHDQLTPGAKKEIVGAPDDLDLGITPGNNNSNSRLRLIQETYATLSEDEQAKLRTLIFLSPNHNHNEGEYKKYPKNVCKSCGQSCPLTLPSPPLTPQHIEISTDLTLKPPTEFQDSQREVKTELESTRINPEETFTQGHWKGDLREPSDPKLIQSDQQKQERVGSFIKPHLSPHGSSDSKWLQQPEGRILQFGPWKRRLNEVSPGQGYSYLFRQELKLAELIGTKQEPQKLPSSLDKIEEEPGNQVEPESETNGFSESWTPHSNAIPSLKVKDPGSRSSSPTISNTYTSFDSKELRARALGDLYNQELRRSKINLKLQIWKMRSQIGFYKRKLLCAPAPIENTTINGDLDAQFHWIHWHPHTTDKINNVGRYFDLEKKRLVAIKIYGYKSPMTEIERLEAKLSGMVEINALMQIEHVNIVGLISHFELDGKLFMILESCDHTLRCDLENAPNGLHPQAARTIISQLLAGLNFCHQAGLLHRDLSPENIYLTSEGRVKLGDFDKSFQLTVSGGRLTCSPLGPGTITYGAPELLAKTFDLTLNSDIWSLGCILIELLNGCPPWDFHTEAEQLYQIDLSLGSSNGRSHLVCPGGGPSPSGVNPRTISFIEELIIPTVSDDTLTFIANCLEIDPRKRMNSKDLIEHPYLSNQGNGDVKENPAPLQTQLKIEESQSPHEGHTKKEDNDNVRAQSAPVTADFHSEAPTAEGSICNPSMPSHELLQKSRTIQEGSQGQRLDEIQDQLNEHNNFAKKSSEAQGKGHGSSTSSSSCSASSSDYSSDAAGGADIESSCDDVECPMVPWEIFPKKGEGPPLIPISKQSSVELVVECNLQKIKLKQRSRAAKAKFLAVPKSKAKTEPSFLVHVPNSTHSHHPQEPQGHQDQSTTALETSQAQGHDETPTQVLVQGPSKDSETSCGNTSNHPTPERKRSCSRIPVPVADLKPSSSSQSIISSLSASALCAGPIKVKDKESSFPEPGGSGGRSPQALMKQIINSIHCTSWGNVDGFIAQLEELVKTAPSTFTGNVGPLIGVILEKISTSKSKEVGPAVKILKALYQFAPKLIESETEKVISGILGKVGGPAFIEAECIDILKLVVETGAPVRICLALSRTGTTHRLASGRTTTAKYLCEAIKRLHFTEDIGDQTNSQRRLTSQLFEAATRFSRDTNPVTKDYGKEMYSLLLKHSEFWKLYLINVSEEQRGRVNRMLDEIRKTGRHS